MAASLKISELNAVASLSDSDLFLITDSSESTSKKLTVSALTSHLRDPVYAALGHTAGATNMGVFTGALLGDNKTVKQLFQIVANAVTSEIATRTDADAVHTAAVAAHDTRLGVLETDPTTKSYVDTAIAGVRDNAPENLDTLNELAAALGDNPDIITTLQAELTDYKAYIEARNLEAGLALGDLYVEELTGG